MFRQVQRRRESKGNNARTRIMRYVDFPPNSYIHHIVLGSTPGSESRWQRHTSKSALRASDFDPLRLEADPDPQNSVVKSAAVVPANKKIEVLSDFGGEKEFNT
ncbi:hypothetical protein BDZ89DRAFT_1126658 [Hymenopellis radicata]|nr:hypothetical protein BDZ89DRAFT_1126658 [Hymenopellis radicata]